MSYGQISNTGIARLTTYASAVAFEQSVIPIRRRSPEIKPLGKRDRADEFKIRAANGMVECIYHRTSVVVFKQDRTITIDCDGFNTQSTISFIGRVLGIWGRIFNDRIRLTIKGKEYSMPEGGLKLDEDFNVLNPMQECIHKMSRKNLTNVRKRYAPFLKYADNTLRLLGNQFTKEHFELRDKAFSKQPNVFFELVNDDNPETKHESHWQALVALAWSVKDYSLKVNPKLINDAFTDLIIRMHRDEVLTEVPLEIGTVAKDRYAKYYV